MLCKPVSQPWLSEAPTLVHMSESELNVLDAFKTGEVPHIKPEVPCPSRSWPRIPAGPERLEQLLSLWFAELPDHRKDSLRAFLSLGQGLLSPLNIEGVTFQKSRGF